MNKLSQEEQRIILHKGTERPYTNEYRDHFTEGIYVCRQCESPLYWSQDKFESDCGWPSFDDALPGKVVMTPDEDGSRTEITCKNCGGHLGHVFVGEQQTDTSVRHCVNSLSMRFVSEKDFADDLKQQIPEYEIVYLGGGCFRCLEGPLRLVPGILEVRSGYMGGKRPFPNYERVSTGVSGYIEIVQVFFDPRVVSYQEILGYFFALHDPTSLDRQGNDIGSQYRSVIFTTSPEQQTLARQAIETLESSGDYSALIVTELRKVEKFYLAESYHQNFYENNPSKPYCQLVVKPKVEKIKGLLGLL